MPGQNLTRLNVALTAQLSPFSNAMSGATSVVEKFGEKIKHHMLEPLFAVTALISTGALIEGLKHAVERIDNLAKSADKIGITTEALAELQYAAGRTGTSAEALDIGIRKMTQTIEKASRAPGEARDAIESLRLTIDDLRGLNAAERFGVIADAIKDLGTSGERTAAALAIFGKTGDSLNNMIELGKVGLEEEADRARKLGLAISRVDAAKVEQAHEAMRDIGQAIDGIFNKLLPEIAPQIVALSDAVVDLTTDITGVGDAFVGTGDKIIRTSAVIADAWSLIERAAVTLALPLTFVAAGIEMILLAVKDLVWVVTQGFAHIDDVAIALGEGLFLVFEMAFNKIRNAFGVFAKFVNDGLADNVIIPFGNALNKMYGGMGDSIKSAGEAMKNNASDYAKSLKDTVVVTQSEIDKVANKIKATWDDIKPSHDTMLESLISTTFNGIVTLMKGVHAAWTTPLPGNAIVAKWEETKERVSKIADEIANRVKDRQKETISKYVELLHGAFDAERDGLNAGQIAEQERYNARLEQLKQYHEKGLASEAQYQAMLEQERSEHETKLSQISLTGQQQQQNWNKITTQQLSQMWASTFQNLMTLTQGHNKKAFQVAKMAAYATAVINTAAGVTQTFKDLGWWALFGPAEAVLAAGLVQIASISAQKFDASGKPGSVGGGGGSTTPSTGVGPTGGAAQPGQTLVLQGDFFSAESLSRIFDEAHERGFIISGVRHG